MKFPNQKVHSVWMDEVIRFNNMLPTGDWLYLQGYIQVSGEGMDKDVLCQWKPEKVGIVMLILEKIGFK